MRPICNVKEIAMSIVSSEIIARNPQVDGRVYVTERHVDHAGKEFTFEYLTNSTEAEQEEVRENRIPQIEASSAQSELEFYEQLVLDGIPILTDYPPKYNDVSTIYGYLFTKFSAESDPVKLLKAANFTDIFTDEELSSYGLTAEQITAIRTEAAKIKDAKALLDGYVPPLGG